MSQLSLPQAGKAPDILDHAEALFGQLGYAGVSVNDVAQAAGVSKANVFHHFKTKEDLYLAVLYRARQRFVGKLVAMGPAPGDAGDGLRALSRAYLQQILEHEPLVLLMMRELMAGRTSHKSLAKRVFADNFSALADVLREAQQRGELRAGFDPAMVMMILSAVSVHYLQTREFMGHLPGMAWTRDPERISSALADILWQGVAPRD